MVVAQAQLCDKREIANSTGNVQHKLKSNFNLDFLTVVFAETYLANIYLLPVLDATSSCTLYLYLFCEYPAKEIPPPPKGTNAHCPRSRDVQRMSTNLTENASRITYQLSLQDRRHLLLIIKRESAWLERILQAPVMCSHWNIHTCTVRNCQRPEVTPKICKTRKAHSEGVSRVGGVDSQNWSLNFSRWKLLLCSHVLTVFLQGFPSTSHAGQVNRKV